MTPEILNAIKKFEGLQIKYSTYGANDSEILHVFQTIITHALRNRKIKIGSPIKWPLKHKDENTDTILEELTEQAWNVYTTILSFSQKSDIEALKQYCTQLLKM